MKFDHADKNFPLNCHDIFDHYRGLNLNAISGAEPYVFNSIFAYEDIREVLQDHINFSSVMPRVNELLMQDAGALIESDPPIHTKYKSIIQPYLYLDSNTDFQKYINLQAGKIIDENIGKEVNVVESIGGKMSIKVIARILGMNDSDCEYLREWTNKFSEAAGHELVSTNPEILNTQKQEITLLHEDLTHFLHGISQGENNRNERSLLSEYENWDISKRDAFGIIKSIAFAGNHSTAILIANALYLMGKHKNQLDLLKSDFDRYCNSACLEVLRFMGTFRGVMRRVANDFSLTSGHFFEQGQYALVWISSGNRDKKIFSSPNEFNITRSNLNKQLAFGYGRHYCTGFQIATSELRAVLGYICENDLNLRIVSNPIRISDPWVDGFEKVVMKISRNG